MPIEKKTQAQKDQQKAQKKQAAEALKSAKKQAAEKLKAQKKQAAEALKKAKKQAAEALKKAKKQAAEALKKAMPAKRKVTPGKVLTKYTVELHVEIFTNETDPDDMVPVWDVDTLKYIKDINKFINHELTFDSDHSIYKANELFATRKVTLSQQNNKIIAKFSARIGNEEGADHAVYEMLSTDGYGRIDLGGKRYAISTGIGSILSVEKSQKKKAAVKL